MSVATLPVVDLDVFLSTTADPESIAKECQKAADALITYGALLVHDSRVSESDNAAFLDLMEDYFAQPTSVLERDSRPEVGYQIGVTLENTEKPRCAAHPPCLDVIKGLAPEERPLDISAHNPDPKCRFFWRMGEAPPYQTEFPGLNLANVVPSTETEHIKQRWTQTMETWGKTMRTAVGDVAEMAALGLGLPKSTFRDAGRYGPHILAPTASDLTKHGELDTILAGFHTDLNFLTIHGRSRYPGLNIWARNTGSRIPVSFPPGGQYLLVQAGKQLEHLTGGLVKAGYHEVVVNAATRAAMERRAREAPGRPMIRISSTFFWHLSSDFELRPIEALQRRAGSVNLGQETNAEVYEVMKVGQQVQNELKSIALLA